MTLNSLHCKLICVILISFVKSDTVVTISNGKIQGTENRTIEGNKTYYAFRGIPYAQPPLGIFRFAPPQPAKPWNGTLAATADRAQCLQGATDPTGSEDCLFISVYTPNLQPPTPLPVLVYIYGGGFDSGSANYTSQGPDYFLDQNLVVVLFNYRLGIFGFISTGDLVSPGNNGLRDQILALKWVQENIPKFGGDPQKVTISGESAGAASVSYLTQTPLAAGLFRGAIMESGTSLCMWALKKNMRQVTVDVAQALGISSNDSQTIIDGLRKVAAGELQEKSSEIASEDWITGNPLGGLPFAPVQEPSHPGAVLSEKSHEILRQGKFNKVPMIIGHNSEEANVNIPDSFLFLARVYLTSYDFVISRLVPDNMNLNASEELGVALRIKLEYWGILPVAWSTKNTLQFISDDMFDRPVTETVNLQSNFVPVYFYIFSYVGLLGNGPNSTKQTSGVGHAEELPYLWRTSAPANPADKIIRQRVVRLWSDFVKQLNPTPEKIPLLQNVTWPTARQPGNPPTNFTYLDIGSSLVVKQTGGDKRLQFWSELYGKYGNSPYDAY